MVGYDRDIDISPVYPYDIIIQTMPANPQYKIIRKRVPIHPPEADAIARAFGDVESQVRRKIDEIEKKRAILSTDWEGFRQVEFMNDSGMAVQKMNVYAERLRNYVNYFKQLTVEIEVEEKVML